MVKLMSLNELSEIIKRIKAVPIEDVSKDILHLEEVIKYVRHTKKRNSAAKKLQTLKDFKIMRDMFDKNR